MSDISFPDIKTWCETQKSSCEKKIFILQDCKDKESFTELLDDLLSDFFEFEVRRLELRRKINLPQPILTIMKEVRMEYMNVISFYKDYKVLRDL